MVVGAAETGESVLDRCWCTSLLLTYDAVCDEGDWPRKPARLEESLCMFVAVLV